MATTPSPFAKGLNVKQSKLENVLSLSICIEDLQEQVATYGRKAANGKTYLNVDLFPKPEADQYGNIYNAKINTWVPTAK